MTRHVGMGRDGGRGARGKAVLGPIPGFVSRAFFREVCQALQLEDFALENQPTAGPTALSSPLSP